MKLEKHVKEPTQLSLLVQEQFRFACANPGKWCPFDGVQAPVTQFFGAGERRIRTVAPRKGPGLEYARKAKRRIETWAQLSEQLFPGYRAGMRIQLRQHPEGLLAPESDRVAVQICVGGALGVLESLDTVIPDEAVQAAAPVIDRKKTITLPGGYRFVIRHETDGM